MHDKVVIYRGVNGEIKFNADLSRETIWATQAQIVQLFNIDQSVVSRHINNIFKSGEVEEKSNMQKMHVANSDKLVNLYNLDMILAVGYRSNSKQAIEFRRWTSSVLKDYLLQGMAVNQDRLDELNKIIEIVSRSEIAEVSGVATLLKNYTSALNLLEQYDEDKLPEPKGKKSEWELNYVSARKFLDQIEFAKENANFAKERGNSFAGIVAGLYQTFASQELYPTTDEKAANLLYQVVKDHPFLDGNKRSAAALFVYFLDKNDALRRNGKLIVEPNTLAAMTLMVALSEPREKDTMIKMVCNLLEVK
jgi:prophage maintenance system killer protein